MSRPYFHNATLHDEIATLLADPKLSEKLTDTIRSQSNAGNVYSFQ